MRSYRVTWDEAVRFDVPYIKYNLNPSRRRRVLFVQVERKEGEEEALSKWIELVEPFLRFDEYSIPIKEIDLTVHIAFSGFVSRMSDLRKGNLV